MARIRTIKPEFFTSLTVASLPIEVRLTFIGLWTHVDDEGRCVDDARLIRAAVWPLDERTPADIECDLKVLTESSLITRYTVSGRSYLAVNGWSEHQRINRPTRSRLPAPSEADRADSSRGKSVPASENALFPEPSPSTHAQLSEDSPPERNREQGKEQGTGKGHPPSAGADAPPDDEPTTTTETEGQRVNRLAKTYTDKVKLSNFPAVAGVVRKAVRAGLADPAISRGLATLAAEERPVTADTLRIAISQVTGHAARRSPGNGRRYEPFRNPEPADYDLPL